ncbi:MAG: HD domain-containing protein, partial [Chloroflexi bacterium]|nr:HD domain-containing protein [Chloroflexota bacterium]
LRLAGLLHDVGKGKTQSIDENGRIRFLTHEKVGATMATDWLRDYCMSNKAIDHVKWSVHHHMRPLSLLNSLPLSETPSRRAIYRFFHDARSSGIDVGLLTLADYLATHNGKGIQAEWEHLLKIVDSLFMHYFNHFDETVAPTPLLNGQDLMQVLQLKPGPEIGRLLRLITEAQAAGDLHTRDEALSFAHKAAQ